MLAGRMRSPRLIASIKKTLQCVSGSDGNELLFVVFSQVPDNAAMAVLCDVYALDVSGVLIRLA